MLPMFRSTRHGPTTWARRVALLALTALEMAIVVSPLIESHHEAPETHAEQSGTTHHFLVHNEATCAVCTLRSMGQLPASAGEAVATPAPVPAAPERVYLAAPVRDAVAHAPRAPPALG
jgi:hypothetical protein